MQIKLNGSKASIASRLSWQLLILGVKPSGKPWEYRYPNGTRPVPVPFPSWP